MPTLSPNHSIGEVAEIMHAAIVLGPAAWGREPMPEAHMAADIEDRLKSQLIQLFAFPSLYQQGRFEKVLRYEADIAILYQASRPNIEPLLSELKPFLTEGQLDDLKTIVTEMKQRIVRVERAAKNQASQ